jgi:hypothetical protein
MDNKRRFTRVAVQIRVQVSPDGEEKVIAGAARDISLKGAFVTASEKVPEDTACAIDIFLGEEEPIKLKAHGKVVRSAGEGIAVEFDQLDVDAYEHLKRVVLYNAKDTDQVEHEFETSRGINRD